MSRPFRTPLPRRRASPARCPPAGAAAPPAPTFPTTPPRAGRGADAQRADAVDRRRCRNGLQVISVRRAGLPLVTAQLLIRRGGEMDPPKLAGLASLTANLLTKGAAGKTAPQIAAAAEALGGSLDASAGWDESEVGITVTTPKLAQALALLADVVRRPTFAEDELDRARKRRRSTTCSLTLSRPTALAALAAARSVFGDGAYGHSRSGTPASLAADRPRRRAAAARRRCTGRTTPSWCSTGDITPAQAAALAQRQLRRLEGARHAPLPAVPAGAARRQRCRRCC